MKCENDGGPGVHTIVQLLRSGNNPDGDIRTFIQSQLAFWLLAAIDGHAKNFSIFLLRDGYALTPLYDVVSAWPIIGRSSNQLALQHAKLAMSIGCTRKRYKLQSITTRHWKCVTERAGVEFDELVHLVERVEPALSRVEARLPEKFPIDIWTPIANGMREQVEKFRLGREPT
jgi:serine/threonine-protein kinase HipA